MNETTTYVADPKCCGCRPKPVTFPETTYNGNLAALAEADASSAEITIFIKSGGPLTKHIHLAGDGTIVNDSSACTMGSGAARRVKIATVKELADLIHGLQSNQAISLGTPRSDLPDEVEIISTRKYKELKGQVRPNVVTRTKSNIVWREGRPAFALLDFDTKGMPPDVADRLAAMGGFWGALVTVLPALRTVARVVRLSTSAGLVRTDTGEQLPGSSGQHLYVAVKDGVDVERFLETLHARCWLAGLGWMMVGKSGLLLERSIVDRTVSGSERLVFEGPPELDPLLRQDVESRRPVATDGDALDTVAACLPLTDSEQKKLRELIVKEKQRLKPESERVRREWSAQRVERMMARGVSRAAAESAVEQQSRGILMPDVELVFTDPDVGSVTVADVLADPARFVGLTLADPVEDYGDPRVAMIMRKKEDGTPFIHSYVHGGANYDLRHDDVQQRSHLPAAHRHGETSAALNTSWLIKNLLSETGTGLLSGQWGTGKTFVALDISGSMMPDADQVFFIDYRIKRRGGVLFVAAEGSGGIRLRFETMLAKKLGRSLLDQDNPDQPFAWIDFQPQLLRRGPKDLIEIAKREGDWMQKMFRVDPVLIVIDTVAASAAFQKEDDAGQAQAVMSALGKLSQATGALVLGVDHFGKNVEAGTRGSSAKESYADNVLALIGKREVTGHLTDLQMGVRKVREGEIGRVIPFRLETINCGTDEDGDAITTCVVHWEPTRQASGRGPGRPRNDHTALLRALSAALRDHGETVGPNGIQAVKVDAVREAFERQTLEMNRPGEDLTDNALKLRWKRHRKAAIEDGAVMSQSFDGKDYLWELEQAF